MNKAEVNKEKKEIKELEKQLVKKREIRSTIDREIYELNKLILEKEKNLSIYDYYDCVKKFLKSSEDYSIELLDYNTPTTKMMTDLKCGRTTTWDLEGEIEYETSVSYYIINYRYILLYSGSLHLEYPPKCAYSLTATEFKKIRYLPNKPTSKNLRNMKVTLCNGESVQLYDYPVLLRGQTDFDKDYRKEWINGELEYEGNNYGDTSDFYLVGEIV